MHFDPFRLERFFAATEFDTPHLLAVSDCQTRSVGALLDLEAGASERFRRLALSYTDSDGSLELREAIAGRYTTVAPDDVLVHATAVEAIYTTMRALLGPGDRVVVQMPAYQALWGAAAMTGAVVVPWWGRPESAWGPDVTELDRLLADDQTRLLVINSPHNPTGWYAGESDLRDIVDAAGRAGVRLFCDEAYRGTEFAPAYPAAPSVVDLDPRAIVLGLVSKGLGLPGLRTGWLASRDADALARVRGYKDFTSICGPAPSEFLSALALRHADVLLAETRDVLSQNFALLSEFMHRFEDWFSWVPPRAGSVTFPLLRNPAQWGGTSAFCDRVRSEAGVLLAPGPLFAPLRAGPGGDPPADAALEAIQSGVRVGIGRASFPQALSVLAEWLDEHAGDLRR